jgi:hypothetical protein
MLAVRSRTDIFLIDDLLIGGAKLSMSGDSARDVDHNWCTGGSARCRWTRRGGRSEEQPAGAAWRLEPMGVVTLVFVLLGHGKALCAVRAGRSDPCAALDP